MYDRSTQYTFEEAKPRIAFYKISFVLFDTFLYIFIRRSIAGYSTASEYKLCVCVIHLMYAFVKAMRGAKLRLMCLLAESHASQIHRKHTKMRKSHTQIIAK